jgi:hypothetical protein
MYVNINPLENLKMSPQERTFIEDKIAQQLTDEAGIDTLRAIHYTQVIEGLQKLSDADKVRSTTDNKS